MVEVRLAAPLLAVDIVLLRGSSGVTSLAALACIGAVAIIVATLPIAKLLRCPGLFVAVIVVVVLVAATAYLFANIEDLADLLGRDPTLTGRRGIWNDVRASIEDRPWVGYGYWAFWERPDLVAATYARAGSAYGSAHNSALEIFLGLGVVGLTIYIFVGLSAQRDWPCRSGVNCLFRPCGG